MAGRHRAPPTHNRPPTPSADRARSPTRAAPTGARSASRTPAAPSTAAPPPRETRPGRTSAYAYRPPRTTCRPRWYPGHSASCAGQHGIRKRADSRARTDSCPNDPCLRIALRVHRVPPPHVRGPRDGRHPPARPREARVHHRVRRPRPPRPAPTHTATPARRTRARTAPDPTSAPAGTAPRTRDTTATRAPSAAPHAYGPSHTFGWPRPNHA